MRHFRSACTLLVLLCILLVPTWAGEVRVPAGASIQQAIDAAPEGATILLDPGEYEGSITLRKPIALVGSSDPANPTVLRSTTLFPPVTIEGGAEAELTDLVIEGTRRFRSDTIAVYGSADAVLRRVEARGSRGNGVNVYSSGTTEIVGCRIHSNDGFAVVVQTSSAKVLGRDNDLRGNGAELGLYAPACLRAPIAPQTESQYVRVPTDYDTVQEAIDAVAPGGVVELMEGEFSESLVLWKPLTLRGQGVESTQLGAPPETMYGGSAVHATTRLLLEGMEIRRPWVISSAEAALTNIRVACSDEVGIEFVGARKAFLKSVDVRNVRGPGLTVHDGCEAELVDCSFSECQEGLRTGGRSSVSVSLCTFSSCTMADLVIGADTSAHVVETGFVESQIGVASSGTATIERCPFDQATGTAISVSGGTSHIKRCMIRGSAETGIRVDDGTAHIEDCVITASRGEGAVTCGGDARVKIVGSSMSENSGAGLLAFYDARVILDDCGIMLNGIGEGKWANSAGISVADSAIVSFNTCSIGRNAGSGIKIVHWSTDAQMNPQVSSRAAAGSEIYLSDCNVFENALGGLVVHAARRVDVRLTRFERNYANGIELGNAFDGTIELFDTHVEDQLECGVLARGGSNVHVARCTFNGNGSSGVLASGTVHAVIDRCTFSGNLVGVSLVESPQVALTDCEITGNTGYGLMLYCLECSGGRHVHQADFDFTGQLSGSGNIIPDLDALNGNGLGGICPDGWEFPPEGSAEAAEG